MKEEASILEEEKNSTKQQTQLKGKHAICKQRGTINTLKNLIWLYASW